MTDLLAELTRTLGGTYRFERELGGGGMSRVFLAEEIALGRKVVVKVLPPEMAASVNQDRFRREMQVVARLQHPHIVPLLNAGLAGELLWYSMPFVEGESLRTRLNRSGELPVAEAARLLREVAEALEHAHEHGVVHRDIKPDNVLLSGGHAVVTDFGVAKAVTDAGAAGTLTSVGFALGTPAYMAPEQAAADPHTDERADLYALGAMAYEMLTGAPPFNGPTPQSVLAAHMTQAPAAVSSRRSAIPPALNAVVMRCLEKRPADRFQKARDLLPQLDLFLTPSSGTMATAATPASSGTDSTLRRANPLRVAGLFALGSLLTLLLTWWLVQRLGLPGWVFPAAMGLLLIGLPMVLRASRHEQRRARAEATGGALPVPAGPLGRLSTLRGAVQGGALAFAGLVVGVGAFMGLRAAGIGPFATLVSAGVLTSRDMLVLADFENRTPDSTLSQTVTEALRIDLTRSTVVRLIESSEITAALERMQRPAGLRLTPALAQEVAVREGAKATIAGDIAPLGDGFVLSARIISSSDGSTLLAERESANGPSELIAAVDRLSRKVREGIGESLRSIRAGVPLEEVTTPSLDALRKYSQAERLADQGRFEDAKVLLDEALRLDSSFAMAWRKRAVVLGNTASDRAGEVAAVQRAYDLRDRLPERERLIATAYYHDIVDRDRKAQISAYQDLLQRWPDDLTALNNLAIALNEEGRFREAEAASRHGLELSPSTGSLWAILIGSQALQGNFSASDTSLRRWGEADPEAEHRPEAAAKLGWARNDLVMVTAFSDSALRGDQLVGQSFGRAIKATVARVQGRLEESARLLREVQEIDARRGASRYMSMSLQARTESTFGRGQEAAIRYLDSALARYPLHSMPPLNRSYPQLSAEYARAGALDRAEALMREYEREVPEVLRNTPERYTAEGLIAQARGEHARAIAAFRTSREREGCQVCRLYEIGQSFDALNLPDSVLATYEALITTPAMGPMGRDYALPGVYRRLGELYEGKGDIRKALEYYRNFVELWKDADPILQPRVAEVRRRITELSTRER